MNEEPVLYIFGGLPASGKSTLARHLAYASSAVYLRIDSIEQAILDSGALVGPEGYEAAYRLAGDNLDIGLSVVADSVNPIEITRSAWRNVASQRGLEYQEIEIVCSDKVEHRSRLELRESQKDSNRTLAWHDVENRGYETWDSSHIFDTFRESPEESKERLFQEIFVK